MMKRKIRFVFALLLTAMTAWAQIPNVSYIVTAGSKMDGVESCQKLLDGDIHTKWYEACYFNSSIWVEFKSDKAFVPTGYILTTANDNTLNNYRNPCTWRVFGKLNEDSDWDELSYMYKNNSMDDKNFAPYEFELNNPDHKVYQFFKFVIYDIRSVYQDYCQLSEFQFKGYINLKNMGDAVVTGIQPVYDFNNYETIPVDYTVQDALGNTIDPSNYNAYFDINEEVVTSVGTHTLYLEATDNNSNGYYGMKRVQFWVKPQLSGAGTEASPYLISTNHDWNLFAERVRLGDTYKGKFVKLAADIDVLWMAGSSEVCSFQGTFDGGGKTMTLHLTAEEDACAPFRYLKEAKIMNLNIAGTVESAYSYAASLAAYGYGTCVITNCGSTAEIKSTRTNGHKDFHGGFIAVYYPKWSLTFTDCIFAGKMTGGNSWGVGGFVGYAFATVYYNHCLFAATEFTMDKKNSYTFNGNSDYSKFNGAYTTMNVDSWYGTKLSIGDGSLSKKEFEYQGTIYGTKGTVDIEGIESSYDETGSVIDITPKVYYDHQLLVENQDYEVTTTPSPVQESGNYTMYITGKGGYGGTETRSFRVNHIFKETGTEENPYLIPHSAAWDSFAANIQNGMDYAGKYVKLTDDFDNSTTPITVVAGSDKHPFKGTFLGNNRTLTVNLSGKNKYLAPFSFIENATIRDLTVTGTITSSVEGDGTHGGFAGVNNGNSTFTNCTFTGRMLGTKTTCNGGFVGWTNGNLTYEDCLFAPAEITMSTNGSATFNRNGKNTLTRCYYTTPFGEVQGVKVSASANAIHTTEQIQIGGVNYYRNCDVSGLEKGYKYTGNPITVTPVVTFEGQPLTVDEDYTVQYKNKSDEKVEADELTDAGKYTITITGKGNYAGSYTAEFYIVDKVILANYVFQKGADDEGEYYEINSVDDWNALGVFMAQVNNATVGMRFKLMDNVSVTSMIGTDEDTHSFQGTFDGNGKTLTVTLSGGNTDQRLAPFRFLKNATIRNLTIAGSITITLSGVIDAYGYHGGFSAVNNGETTFENCAFKGSLLGKRIYSNGGFVGWNKGTLHYIDCLFAPAEITMDSYNSATFNRNGHNDFLRTYYVTPFGESQGTRVFADEVEGSVCRTVTAADGNTYYVAQCFAIDSETDWKKFAELVENEDVLVKEYPVVLLSDITVNTTVGTEYHPFEGNFYGNGKTLTVNLEEDNPVMAPFRFVSGALIRNLTVAGVITDNDQSEIGACAGIVGVCSGITTLDKCIFTGSLKGTNTHYCGGLVGWNKYDLTFSDCLFAPTELTISGKENATFNHNYTSTLVRTYYTTPLGLKQGKQAFAGEADVPEDVIAYPETFFNGTDYYVESGFRIDNSIPEGQPGHYYINMPAKSEEYYTIPDGILTFKVYDNGGKDGNARYECDGAMVLTGPSGSLLQASGTVVTYDDYWDGLRIYEGATYSSNRLGMWWSDTDGVPETVGPVITDREVMKLTFYCWDDLDESNVDLTLNVINMVITEWQSNTSVISDKAGRKVNAILNGRKLYKDGDWNTLCLPFALTAEQIAAGDLAGAIIKELDTEGKYKIDNGQWIMDNEAGTQQTGFDASTGTLNLYFKDATSIEAGKPYLIKWAQAIRHIEDPIFMGVTVTATTPAAITSSDGYVSFVGTFMSTNIFSTDRTNLYVGSNNKLYYPWEDDMEDFYIYSCRGYFRLNNGLKAADPNSSTPRLNIVMNLDGETTSLSEELRVKSEEFAPAAGWYTLSGTRLNALPTNPGLYIHNGRKVVIK